MGHQVANAWMGSLSISLHMEGFLRSGNLEVGPSSAHRPKKVQRPARAIMPRKKTSADL